MTTMSEESVAAKEPIFNVTLGEFCMDIGDKIFKIIIFSAMVVFGWLNYVLWLSGSTMAYGLIAILWIMGIAVVIMWFLRGVC